MRFIYFLSLTFTISFNGYAQLSATINDPDRDFKIAKEYFLNKQYALAYPVLNELENKCRYCNNDKIIIKQDLDYYFIITELLLKKETAINAAENFINDISNLQRATAMAFFLGHYYFLTHNFQHAVLYFEKAGYNELDNDQIGKMKYELAYSYFFQKDYAKAKPLFDEIHQLRSNEYYLPSNYYFGFIAFREKDYENALTAFKVVESLPEYNGIVPYYIADIYYIQNNKKEALRYAEKGLSNPNQYYKRELELIAGQIYFEDKLYAEALPYLESYVNNSDKISKQVQYELSFTYYSLNQIDKAVQGFKLLSGENDSLGQNSMYLLGDLYLRSNQKANARNAFEYSSVNTSNPLQQEISKFNYAKLSYDLKFNDIALHQIKSFIASYPNSPYQAESKEILVNLLANSNNFSDALSTYQSIESPSVSLQKIYPKLLFGRATELLNEQRITEATDLFTKILADPSASLVIPFANFWMGEISYRNQQYDEAISFMNKYLQRPGSQGESNIEAANYILGYSFLEKKNYPQALSFFKKISKSQNSKSGPLEQDAYLRTADMFFMLKYFNEAKAIYSGIIAGSMPSSDYALYQNAMIAGVSRPADKVKQLVILTSQFPNSELVDDANLEIANTFMAQEKFKESLPFLFKVISGKSNALKPRALLKTGLSYYNLNDNANALTYYQKLQVEYPQSPESDLALENIKTIYVQAGKPHEYIDFLKKAGKMISVSAADSLTYHAAEVQFLNGDCANAITSFTNYLQAYPSGAFVIPSTFNRSECYAKNKDWKSAVTGYEYVANTSGNKYVEKALVITGRIYYLEIPDYNKSKTYFLKLKNIATVPENKLEALRGLVRTFYRTKEFAEASVVAKDLLSEKNISTDDRSIANLVLGKSLEEAKKYEEAIIAFKEVAALNKSSWGAEARYEIAYSYYNLNMLSPAEKEALEVIRVNGSSDLWVARSYILLGDIYMLQKDYFNAKATFQGVANNATIPELKAEAQQKLDKAIAEEKLNSKISQ